jgi:hypothetical protein
MEKRDSHQESRATTDWKAALTFETVAPILIGIAVLVVLILAFFAAHGPTD